MALIYIFLVCTDQTKNKNRSLSYETNSSTDFLYDLIFFVTLCLVVAVQPCLERGYREYEEDVLNCLLLIEISTMYFSSSLEQYEVNLSYSVNNTSLPMSGKSQEFCF